MDIQERIRGICKTRNLYYDVELLRSIEERTATEVEMVELTYAIVNVLQRLPGVSDWFLSKVGYKDCRERLASVAVRSLSYLLQEIQREFAELPEKDKSGKLGEYRSTVQELLDFARTLEVPEAQLLPTVIVLRYHGLLDNQSPVRITA